MKKLMIIILAVLLSTGIAFAKNQNDKGTSGSQGVGHSKAGNQGNDKDVGNAGGKHGKGGNGGNSGGSPDVGCGSCGNGPDYSGPVSGSPGMVGSLGGPVNGNSGYDSGTSNMSDSDPQIGYRNFKEPGCSLVDWFNNDFTCP